MMTSGAMWRSILLSFLAGSVVAFDKECGITILQPRGSPCSDSTNDGLFPDTGLFFQEAKIPLLRDSLDTPVGENLEVLLEIGDAVTGRLRFALVDKQSRRREPLQIGSIEDVGRYEAFIKDGSLQDIEKLELRLPQPAICSECILETSFIGTPAGKCELPPSRLCSSIGPAKLARFRRQAVTTTTTTPTTTTTTNPTTTTTTTPTTTTTTTPTTTTTTPTTTTTTPTTTTTTPTTTTTTPTTTTTTPTTTTTTPTTTTTTPTTTTTTPTTTTTTPTTTTTTPTTTTTTPTTTTTTPTTTTTTPTTTTTTPTTTTTTPTTTTTTTTTPTTTTTTTTPTPTTKAPKKGRRPVKYGRRPFDFSAIVPLFVLLAIFGGGQGRYNHGYGMPFF